MSLEAKFAELKVDDAPSVVETVKKDGVEKSGLAANTDVLVARAASKDEAEALAALKTIKSLAEECSEAQAFTKECITPCKCRSVVCRNLMTNLTALAERAPQLRILTL